MLLADGGEVCLRRPATVHRQGYWLLVCRRPFARLLGQGLESTWLGSMERCSMVLDGSKLEELLYEYVLYYLNR